MCRRIVIIDDHRSSSSLILLTHPSPSSSFRMLPPHPPLSRHFFKFLLDPPLLSSFLPLAFSLVTLVPQPVPSTCFLPSSLFLLPRPPPSSASPTPPCLIHHLHLFPSSLQKLRSHDPSSLPSDYELPRSSDGHRPCVDLAAARLRPPFGPSNICRRRGPLKLMSKLIS